MRFWNELRRRNVFKVAGAYALLAWLLVQVASAVFPALLLPGWTVTFVTVLLIIGFPVAVFLAWAYELTPDGIKPAINEEAAEALPGHRGSRLNYLLGTLLVLAVGYIAVDRTLLSTETGDDRTGGRIRLAVLPCDNLSPSTDGPDFAPGIHDELLNRLGLIGNLHLTSRTSVLQYTDPVTRPTIPEIGSALSVDAIMECSVVLAGNNLRLTTQVIDVIDDAHLWSSSYTADMSDLDTLFETQAQIAMDVANSVSVQFFASEIEQIATAPTESPEAYQLLLAASGVGFSGREAIERRMNLVDQALDIDAGYVDAWIAKGVNHWFQAGLVPVAEGAVERQRAADAYEQARRLAPANGHVEASLGQLATATGRWSEAHQHFERAIELGLELGELGELGQFQMAVGRFDLARMTFEARFAYEPSNLTDATFLMMTYEQLGDEAARQALFEYGQARYPRWPDVFEATLIPLAEDDRAELRTIPTLPWLTPVVEHLGDPEGGLALLRDLYLNRPDPGAIGQYLLSAWAAYFGDPALALEIQKGLPPGGLLRTWYPVFDAVRRDPGFEQLLDEWGLPEYWNEYGWPDRCTQFDDGTFDCD